MKWLPQAYRQNQKKWYGRAGIPWHVMVFQYTMEVDGQKKQVNQVYTCVMNNHEPQEAAVNFAIIKTLLGHFARANPQIKNAHFRSGKIILNFLLNHYIREIFL